MPDVPTHHHTGPIAGRRFSKPGVKAWASSLLAFGIVAGGVITGPRLLESSAGAAASPLSPSVAVSAPLQRDVDTRLQFLGQFSAVEQVELRAQVGGTLTQIGFKDGDIVHKGDLLFLLVACSPTLATPETRNQQRRWVHIVVLGLVRRCTRCKRSEKPCS